MPRRRESGPIPPSGPDHVKVKMVPAQVARALAKGKGAGIDSGALLACMFESWGGYERFAKDVYAEYQAARPGSQSRQRILELVSRLTVQVTAQAVARPKPVREMTDDELVATVGAILERIDGRDPAPEAEAGQAAED